MPASRRVFALACVAALGMSLTVGTAQAAGPSAPAAPSGPTAILRDSPTLAGYAGPGGQYGVQTTFVVPPFDCRPGEASAFFASVIAYRTVDGAKLINGGGAIEVLCREEGGRGYFPILFDSEGTENDSQTDATPGDLVRLTYFSDPATRTASSAFENLTMGTVSRTSFPFFDTTSVEIGAATRPGIDNVPIFGDVEFKRTIIDGAKITKKTDLTKFNLVDDDGDPLLTTSKIKKHRFVVTPAP